MVLHILSVKPPPPPAKSHEHVTAFDFVDDDKETSAPSAPLRSLSRVHTDAPAAPLYFLLRRASNGLRVLVAPAGASVTVTDVRAVVPSAARSAPAFTENALILAPAVAAILNATDAEGGERPLPVNESGCAVCDVTLLLREGGAKGGKLLSSLKFPTSRVSFFADLLARAKHVPLHAAASDGVPFNDVFGKHALASDLPAPLILPAWITVRGRAHGGSEQPRDFMLALTILDADSVVYYIGPSAAKDFAEATAKLA